MDQCDGFYIRQHRRSQSCQPRAFDAAGNLYGTTGEGGAGNGGNVFRLVSNSTVWMEAANSALVLRGNLRRRTCWLKL